MARYGLELAVGEDGERLVGRKEDRMVKRRRPNVMPRVARPADRPNSAPNRVALSSTLPILNTLSSPAACALSVTMHAVCTVRIDGRM